jgi:hypothetical protein
MQNLKSFAYSHKDFFFQRENSIKPFHLYYNFAYPPFRKTVMPEIIEPFIKKHSLMLNNFLGTLMDESDKEISTVICVGSGFEMFWAKEVVKEFFGDSCDVICPKTPKNVQSEGAALISAMALSADTSIIEIADPYKITKDIGILARAGKKEVFKSIIKSGTFAKQEAKKQSIIFVKNDTYSSDIEIYSRDSENNITNIGFISTAEMPKRHKGMAKLSLLIKPLDAEQFEITLADEGFGEMFPKTDYTSSKTFALSQLAF